MQSPFSSEYNKLHLGDEDITIQLTNTGKRFNRDWVFRHINYKFESGKSYAITGPNGSGKSTLLQTIAGAIAPSEGAVEYQIKDKNQEIRNKKPAISNKEEEIESFEFGIREENKQTGFSDQETGNLKLETSNRRLVTENVYDHLAIVAPYLEVIEEMTAAEFLQFHSSFKPLLSTISINKILEIVGLKSATYKQIRFYSSGMKQRIKLAQAVFSGVSVLLLDEPCTNLDEAGYILYYQLIKEYCKEKLIIVSSNDINEYSFCAEKLSILNYK
jgi:ABC-type multidrug transport system ATPase subunit